MRISHKYKFVFISVPRTASTTCRQVLDQYSDITSIHITKTNDSFSFYHHITAKEVKKIFGEKGWKWDEYKKFCLVRNPFDRVVSLYYLTLRITTGGDKEMSFKFNLKNYIKSFIKPKLKFEDFVLRLNEKNRLHAPITEYITDYDGTILVDNVLSYENIDFELPLFLSEIGINIDKNSITINNNSKSRKNYKQYYDSQVLIDNVSELYNYEIKKYNYEF